MTTWENKAAFKQRVREYAGEIGIEVGMLTMRPMKHKWASCSTNGNLHFNSELLELEKEIGEYVIVHELLHFHAPNHGKLWKSLMIAYIGDYKAIEERIPRLVAA